MTSFPTCQFCYRKFSLKGPAPFLLPCLHPVCETCITSAGGAVLACIKCQRYVALTDTSLQKDVIREKEILLATVKTKPDVVLCTHENDGNQASCWCRECEEFLCERCQNAHGRFKGTIQHTVCDVGELELGHFDVKKYCEVHSGFIADTWDEVCCLLTCAKCRLGDHAGHEVVDVNEAVRTTRKDAATFKKLIEEIAHQHNIRCEAASSDLQVIDETSNNLPEKVDQTFQALRLLIDQREKELRLAHHHQRVTMRNRLCEEKNTSHIYQQRCLTTSDYISKTLKYSSAHEILELRPLLKQKVQDCRKLAPSTDYKPFQPPVLKTEGFEMIKFQLANLGGITSDDAFDNEDFKTIKDILRDILSWWLETLMRSMMLFGIIVLVCVAFAYKTNGYQKSAK